MTKENEEKRNRTITYKKNRKKIVSSDGHPTERRRENN